MSRMYVVNPEGRRAPVRILNTLDEAIELNRGSKIAEFIPLIVSISKQKSTCCGIVSTETRADFKEKAANTINSCIFRYER